MAKSNFQVNVISFHQKWTCLVLLGFSRNQFKAKNHVLIAYSTSWKFFANENANAKDDVNGETSIFKATNFGYDEIIKILAPLSENPNASDHTGTTPINNATYRGFTSTVRLLMNYVENPNEL